MTLEAGRKIGPYEIIEQAGAGGMGEVYKANDTRLDRTVAIKILPSNVAGFPDFKQRFEREAKSISSLNHPNICILYDIGKEDNLDYLVMEFIEGETLSDRLKKGPLATDEHISIGIQIADALEKAHRKGLVHRDLKPGNVMLTKDGAKLLDFGLAKVQIDPNGGGQSTITQSTPLTGVGTIVGTMQYMAPEQLEGKEADSRSDIFSFGILLYEMATGLKAFKGGSQASLIASILKEEPRSVSEVLPAVPPMLEQTVNQCLAKDPDQRWQSAGDLKRALQWISEGKVAPKTGIIPSNRSVRENIIFSALILLIIACTTLAYFYFSKPKMEKPVSKFVINLPAGVTNMQWPVISPDAKQLAFVGTDTNNVRQIWIRPLHSLDAYPLPGTEGALRPFWSPDSRQMAYFSNSQLKKIPVAGGPSQLICETTGADGHWGSKNIILFDNNLGDSLKQVSASGGMATHATILGEGEQLHAWPCFLPDGEHFLYIAGIDSLVGSTESYMLRVANLEATVNKDLFRVGTRIAYSNEGYILYVQDNTLVGRKFDSKKLEVLGDPVPIAENVVVQSGERANFSISDKGILIYQRGQATELAQIVRTNRKGEIIDTILSRGQFGDFSLSPDGRKLAYQMLDQQNSTYDIWVRDLNRSVSSRLTFDEQHETWPIWSPDGKTIIYSSNYEGEFALKKRSANGLGEAEDYFGISGAHLGVNDWSPIDNFLYIVHFKGQPDIWRIDANDTTKAEKLMTSPTIAETQPQLSPSGRFLAHMSSETGQAQVYIRDISSTGGKWQVSSSGGTSPRWSDDGRELFYISNGNEFTAVPMSLTNNALEIGRPEKLFERSLNDPDLTIYSYDVTANGQEFIINIPYDISREQSAEFITVINWSEEIKSED